MRGLPGRVAVVTGAGRGIGLALARAMAARHMRVVLSDVEAARPDQAAAQLREEGADATGVVCDVSDPAAVDRLAGLTMDQLGRVDLLCNNAGIVAGGPTWELALDTWRRVLDVNLWGAIHGVRSFVPLLLQNPDGGHVVNVASLAAVTPVPGIAPYNVSKHGVLALSETLHADLRSAASEVGVTIVMPGRVATALGLPSGAPAADLPGQDEPGVLSAASVADQVMAAVEEDRLYLFTHPDRMVDVEERFEGILGR
jgi:NAD(P)-dependent dehydrogenase (short-subunit alcohol dehydrogenase family)